MSRQTKNLPPREHRPRIAKQKASKEIEKFFKPKRALQIIPENEEVRYPKKIKDYNNNNGNSNSIPSDSGNVKSNLTEKKSFSLAKPKPINLLKLAQQQNAKKMGLLDETVFKHDTTTKISAPVAHSTPKRDESSIEQLSHESGYGFDALHTDDSTDYEDEQTKLPYWCLEKNRLAIVIEQTNVNSKITDAFFDSKPQTVDSQKIFKNSSPIQRRRSTAVWNTPPRYSMLPKY